MSLYRKKRKENSRAWKFITVWLSIGYLKFYLNETEFYYNEQNLFWIFSICYTQYNENVSFISFGFENIEFKL